jgi:hypothetical protein
MRHAKSFALAFALLGLASTLFAQTPHIISISPVQNELDVPAAANIIVTFDGPIDEATINNSTFRVAGRISGLRDGTISYNSNTWTATFDPQTSLAIGDEVTVILTAGIEGSTGTPLDQPFI